MNDQSISQLKENQNRSMLSTHHMSCNQSNTTNFYNQNKGNRSAVLKYSQVPFQKASPRWNQSTATWRHTSYKYSFPKDNRFKDYKVEYTDIIQPQIKSTRTSKSCTFGKGKKKPISEVILRNAKQKPAPDRYNMEIFDQQTRRNSKGKSFGLNWTFYERNYIDHRKDIYAQFQTQDYPSSKYDVRQTPGKQKRKFSMYGRLKMYTSKLSQSKNWVPGARYLLKDRQLDNQVGLHQRNFGFGERIDLSMPANNYPGAKYIIPGFCAKFAKTSKKNENVFRQQFEINS